MYQRFCARLRSLTAAEAASAKRPTKRSASGKVLHPWDITPRSASILRTLGFLLPLPRIMPTAIVAQACRMSRAHTAHFREAHMVYIQRDEHGKLLRVEQEPFPEMSASMAVESEELQN